MATVKPDARANPKPGTRGYLKWWWTKGPGLARWASSPTPFRTLRRQLRGKVPASYINRVVAQWYHDVFGKWPGAGR